MIYYKAVNLYKHSSNPHEINVLVVNTDEAVFNSIQSCLGKGKRASYMVEWKQKIASLDSDTLLLKPHVVVLDLVSELDETVQLVDKMREAGVQLPLVLLSDADNSDEKLINIEKHICEEIVAEAIPRINLDTATVERSISNVLHHIDVENQLIEDENKIDLMMNSIENVNSAAEKLIGLDAESMKGQYFFDVFNFIEDVTNAVLEEKIIQRMRGEETFHFGPDCYLVGDDYSKIFVEVSLAPLMRARDVSGYLVIINDETQKRRWSNKFNFQSSHDPVTGLLNRTGFENVLQQSIRIAEENESGHVLIYIDLDQFKVVNDLCGHAVGDELLRQFSVSIGRNIRKRDTLARIGGDEFALLLWNCNLPESEEFAAKLVEKISDFRFVWGNKTHNVTASLGVAQVTGSTKSWAEALSMADTACCLAKENGRNRVEVAHNETGDKVARRQDEMEWVTRLVQAVDDQGLELYCQPIIPASCDNFEDHLQQKLHYEVLLRYRDQQGKQFGPGAFLPAAERYNVIRLVDRWVIRTTLQWLSDHLEHTNKLELCSINLSGASMNDETMVNYIMNVFEQTLIDPTKICFEVTETAAISHLAKASWFIKELRDKGCKFALDDFGVGMSSFTYLKHMPVDFVKIDGSFVRNIVNDEIDRAMVKSINEIGQIMNKKTIAEFVENAEIMSMLREIGVDYVQGYHISKPIPIGTPFIEK